MSGGYSPSFWESIERRARDVTVIRCSGDPATCPVHGPDGIETQLEAMDWRSAFADRNNNEREGKQ